MYSIYELPVYYWTDADIQKNAIQPTSGANDLPEWDYIITCTAVIMTVFDLNYLI